MSDSSSESRRGMRDDERPKVPNTKEEKQRQNEEIVTLETSSVSSESGSWEIFPTPTKSNNASSSSLIKQPLSLQATCRQFLDHQTDEKAEVETGRDPPATACFIDASSLMDETEVAFASPARAKGYDIKDQYSSDSDGKCPSGSDFFTSDNPPKHHQDDAKKECEKKQGSVVFRGAIRQYSGHFVDPVLVDQALSECSTSSPSVTKSDHNHHHDSDETPSRKSSTSPPIMSGGVSVEDFSPKVFSSPQTKRRTEMCPILSGGVSHEDFASSSKPDLLKHATLKQASWVIDMSLSPKSHEPDIITSESLDTDSLKCKSAPIVVSCDTPLKKSTGFYIPLDTDEVKEPTSLPDLGTSKSGSSKNIFSMFIDIGEKKPVAKKGPVKSRLTKSLAQSKEVEQVATEGRNSAESSKCIMNIFESIPILSSSSCTSNDFTASNKESSASERERSDRSMTSEENIQREEEANDEPARSKNDETFVMQAVQEAGKLSNTLSLTSLATDVDDNTLQNGETSGCSTDDQETPGKIGKSVKISSEKHTMESLRATIEKQKKLLDTVAEGGSESGGFVRLSDLDKPVKAFHLKQSQHKRVKSYEKCIWNMSKSTEFTNRINLASSFENSRSLSRLFPHLNSVFSHSLPNNVGEETISEIQDMFISDMSGESSATSTTYSRSGLESVDESTISSRQPRRLGEDLLKLFLQELGTDVTIDIDGRKIGAHKCILRSRCQYFAAILAGDWIATAGNTIALPGYSYESVHFALCHIYSGATHPPEGISLMELAALADLLGLEGLREITAYALKTNYCHNFHKPCSSCIDGVLKVLPVALTHGLDDLYRKCLKWCCKHYMKIWSTRAFSNLSSDLRLRLQQQIINHITSETVLNLHLESEDLLTVLAPCRWALHIDHTIRNILDATTTYVSEHFSSLLASDSFLSLGHDRSSDISRLESFLLRSAATLSPEQACRTYQRINRLNIVLTEKRNIDDAPDSVDWSTDFIHLVAAILSAVEQCLVRQCSKAMRTNTWHRMDIELKKKIQKLSRIPESHAERRSRPINRELHNQSPSYHNRNQSLHQIRLAIQAHSSGRHIVPPIVAPIGTYRPSIHTQTSHAVDHHVPNIHQKVDKSVQANRDLSKPKVEEAKNRKDAPKTTKAPKVASNNPNNVFNRLSNTNAFPKRLKPIKSDGGEGQKLHDGQKLHEGQKLSRSKKDSSGTNLSIDSLAESVKSSHKSQESLKRCNTKSVQSSYSDFPSIVSTVSNNARNRPKSGSKIPLSTMPTTNPPLVRKSFLSERSRQILERKKAQQEKFIGNDSKDSKSSTPTKKTPRTSTKDTAPKKVGKTSKKPGKVVEKEKSFGDQSEDKILKESTSKLERSSTFCKEKSDIPGFDLNFAAD
ncbi:BTB/POZ domain-containing protein 8 [Lutzomyia longipalpis]|uniref:BTB/POZ domain-containing protein 8 n=1 Tax=Lutzomyia longipalpis TaxID=7200 RepID=UPI0024837FA3|nr:BTB/POZ domain-containing protein 8 [Lutzomyia longipalpis]